MMTKDFIILVGFAFVIASPISYWMMEQWLSDFEYRTIIGWTPLASALFLTLIIAVATVAVQSVKSALANPVDTLKIE